MKTLPFLIKELEFQEERQDVRHELDLELGSVFALVETLRKKKATVDAVLKVAWPVWVVRLKRKGVLIVDGFKTLKASLPSSVEPTSEEVKARVDPLAPEDFLEALRDLEARSASPEVSRSFPGLLRREEAGGLAKLLKYADDDHDFLVQAPSLLDAEAVSKYKEFFDGHAEMLDRIDAACSEIVSVLQAKLERVRSEVSARLEAIGKEYDDKQAKLRAEVEEQVKKLEETLAAEEGKLEDVRKKERTNNLNLVKERLVPIKDALDLLASSWTADHEKVAAQTDHVKLQEEMKHGIQRLKQSHVEFGKTIEKLEKELTGLLAKFGAIDEEFDQRLATLRESFAERVKRERDKLEALAMERREKIGEQEYLLAQCEEVLSRVAGNYNQYQIRREERATRITTHVLDAPTPFTEDVALMGVPVYVAVFSGMEPTHVTFVPSFLKTSPIKKASPETYDQKTLPIVAFQAEFLKMFQASFATALESNPELEELVKQAAGSPSNLISSFDLKGVVDRGFASLNGRKLVKPKDLDKLQAGVNGYFRT
ncbi:MAG: hypothetical protein Kow0069_23200 [Promethearchaeota archaeon]